MKITVFPNFPQPLPKLDPDLKARWLAALRDPNTKQAWGALRYTDGSMCCLGVLCNTVSPDQWNPPRHEPFPDEVLKVSFGDSQDNNIGIPPSLFLRDLNLPRNIAGFLAEHNDDMYPDGLKHTYTFADIADWIEENL